MACSESRDSTILLYLGLLVVACSFCHSTRLTKLKALDKLIGNSTLSKGQTKGSLHYGRLLIGQNSLQGDKFKGTKATKDFLEVDADYQEDMGWGEPKQPQGKGVGFSGPNSTPDSAAVERLLKMEPKVECTGDAMKLQVQDAVSAPGSLFFVDRGSRLSPLPLSKLPPSCGYTIASTRRDLVLVAPYDGCFVTREEDSYVLPLRWWGLPVRMSCPLMSQSSPNPPMVACHAQGMVVKTGWTVSATKINVDLNGTWEPLMKASSRCGFSVVVHPEGVVVSIRFSPCLEKKDGMYTLKLNGEGVTEISCPSLAPFQTEHTAPKQQTETPSKQVHDVTQIPEFTKNPEVPNKKPNQGPMGIYEPQLPYYPNFFYPYTAKPDTKPTTTVQPSQRTIPPAKLLVTQPFKEPLQPEVPSGQVQQPYYPFPFYSWSVPEKPTAAPRPPQPEAPQGQVQQPYYPFPFYPRPEPEKPTAAPRPPQPEAPQGQVQQPYYPFPLYPRPEPEKPTAAPRPPQPEAPQGQVQQPIYPQPEPEKPTAAPRPPQPEAPQGQVQQPYYPFPFYPRPEPEKPTAAPRPPQPEAPQGQVQQPIYPQPEPEKPTAAPRPPQPEAPQGQVQQPYYPFPFYPRPEPEKPTAAPRPPQPEAPQGQVQQPYYPFPFYPRPEPEKPTAAPRPPQPEAPQGQVQQPIYPWPEPEKPTAAPRPPQPEAPQGQVQQPIYPRPVPEKPTAAPRPPQPEAPQGQVQQPYYPFPFYPRPEPEKQTAAPMPSQPEAPQGQVQQPYYPFPFYPRPEPEKPTAAPRPPQPEAPQGQVQQPYYPFPFYPRPEPEKPTAAPRPPQPEAPQGQVQQPYYPFPFYPRPEPEKPTAAPRPPQPEAPQGQVQQPYYQFPFYPRPVPEKPTAAPRPPQTEAPQPVTLPPATFTQQSQQVITHTSDQNSPESAIPQPSNGGVVPQGPQPGSPYIPPVLCPEFCPSGFSNCCPQIAFHQHLHQIIPAGLGGGDAPSLYPGLPFLPSMTYPGYGNGLGSAPLPQKLTEVYTTQATTTSTSAPMSSQSLPSGNQKWPHLLPPDGNPAALLGNPSKSTNAERPIYPYILPNLLYPNRPYLPQNEELQPQSQSPAHYNVPSKTQASASELVNPVLQYGPYNVQPPNWPSIQLSDGDMNNPSGPNFMSSIGRYLQQQHMAKRQNVPTAKEQQPSNKAIESKRSKQPEVQSQRDHLLFPNYRHQDAKVQIYDKSMAPIEASQPFESGSKKSTKHEGTVHSYSEPKGYVLLQHGPPGNAFQQMSSAVDDQANGLNNPSREKVEIGSRN